MVRIIFFVYRLLLKLRYRVTVIGEEHLQHDGPLLVLPNHVALVDPQILVTHLNRYTKIGPVMSQAYYEIPVLKSVFRKMGAVPIGDLEVGKGSQDEIVATFSTITDALAENRNILIYPAGQLKAQGKESIIGKQAVYHIVKLMPKNTKVIGVTIKGLWGSRMSKAWEGKTPSLAIVAAFAILWILTNLIFFIPKRKVTVTIEDITGMTKRNLTSLSGFNKALEDYYNADGEESLSYQRHFFYYNDVKGKAPPKVIRGSLTDLADVREIDERGIPDEVKSPIIAHVSQMKGMPPDQLSLNSKLIIDCLCDSLDLAELKSFVQTSFASSSNPSILELKTIGDLCLMALGRLSSEALKPCEWNAMDTSGSCPDELQGSDEKRILELLLKMSKKHGKSHFCYDAMLGTQTWEEFNLKATILSRKIREIPSSSIGIMLPSLSLTSMTIVATYMAGKIPVMMNWTLPKTAFEHCVGVSGITRILTSSNFYSKVKNEAIECQADKMLYLEDLLKDLTLGEKISGMMQSKLKRYPHSKSDTAVILFTSGSESLPKAVSLTHANLVSCIRGSLELFPLSKKESILSFLPPFHSFGFTINTILPLITGLRTVFTPDPNDAGTIISLLKHTQATVVTATPTFLKMILSQAGSGDLASIRYAVVGAEKCTQEIADLFKVKSPSGTILEGYGITECSPVLSINPIDAPKLGSVGKPLPSLTMKIIGLEDPKEMGVAEQGMIYVRGPSVFGGYLDPKLESPFRSIDGESYYSTGDLGSVDADGYLFITGRLKRFVKIAGEMVSLPYIEGLLLEVYGIPGENCLAIEAKEENGNVRIVGFSTRELSADTLNASLRAKGVNNLIRLESVRRIEAIPVLGTGKIDYKVLKAMI